MTVDVSVACPAWDADLPDAAGLAERALRAALAALPPVPGAFEVSVLLTDDDAQRRLNRDWRGQDRATNVLAFPDTGLDEAADDGIVRGLGDIVLAHGVVDREARSQGKTLAAHATHLLVHGFLHLAGFEHDDAAAAERMEAMEIDILQGLGIADPYAASAAAGSDEAAAIGPR